MKKIIVSFLAVLLSGSTIFCWGQVAQWVIRPEYDSLIPDYGENVILGKTQDNAIQMWDLEGNLLVERIEGKLYPFYKGKAILTDETNYIKGIYTNKGDFISVTSKKRLSLRLSDNERPILTDGHVRVWDKEDNRWRYLDAEGKVSPNYYLSAKPFINGYASCITDANQEKHKDRCCFLLQEDLSPVIFSYNRKGIEPKSIEYISSINDSHVGVVIANRKIYLFNADAGTLSPLCATENEHNPKSQAKLQIDDVEPFKLEANKTFGGKCGKKDYVVLEFDSMKRLIKISYSDGTEKEWPSKEEKPVTRKSSLSSFRSRGIFGLKWAENDVVLPEQFETKPICYDDKAIVTVGGKFGLIKVDPDSHFNLVIHKADNNPIPFRHEVFSTTLRLDMPAFIPAEKAHLEMAPDQGCTIDPVSADTRNTAVGNRITYQCDLQIPPELNAEDEIEKTFRAQVRYDLLVSPLLTTVVKARYYKYYTISIQNAVENVEEGSYSFKININKESSGAEDVDVFLDVRAQLDTLLLTPIRESETQYECRIEKLNEGLNNLVIEVKEKGCPPVRTAYDIVYTKPVKRSKNKAAVQGSVTLNKKEEKAEVVEQRRELIKTNWD